MKLKTIKCLHVSKVMLKILQARLQQYVYWELPDLQAGFRKGRGLSHQQLCGTGVVAAWCWTNFEETPHIQGQRRSPSKMLGRGKISFRIKSHTQQRCLEGSNIPCMHQDRKTLQRLRQNCVWVSPVEVQVSSGLPQGQRLWVQQTWVWHKPSLRRSLLTPL